MIHRVSVTVQCVLSFRAPRFFSLAKNEAKRPRFCSDSNAVPGSSRNEWPQTGAFIARRRSAPIRLQWRQRRSRLASLLLMLHGVADVLRTILFIPDPFR